MYRRTFCILLSVLCLVSCVRSAQPPSPVPAEVVVVFKDAPQWFVLCYQSGVMHRKDWSLAYVDGDGVYRQHRNGVLLPDTLRIGTAGRSHVELEHYTHGTAQLLYLLQAGDTVVFTYDSTGFPTAHSNLSEQLTQAYNLYPQRQFLYAHRGMSPLQVLEPYSTLDCMCYLKKNNPKLYNEIFAYRACDFVDTDSIKILAQQQFVEDKLLYDLLYATGALPPAQFEYIKYRRTLDSLVLWNNLRNRKKGWTDIPPYNIYDFADSLAWYPSAIYRLFSGFYAGIGRRIQLLEGQKISRVINYESHGGAYTDYRIIFDFIASDTTLTPVQRNLMLYFATDDIVDDMPVADKERYLSKFLELTGDTAKYRYIVEQYGLDFSTTGLDLIAVSGERFTFDAMLKQHRGKIVYLDFWGVGCIPCCRAMPDAAALRAEYAGRDVTFVYLSLDRDANIWRENLPELQLNGADCYNYIVANQNTSKVLESMNIQSIPRYMLYGRDGRLLHDNAPGPHGEAIRRLLDAELGKQ